MRWIWGREWRGGRSMENKTDTEMKKKKKEKRE